ncbi:DUF4102 domain-containing protein [Undibacterium piscinae]|uniref:DUF4102 domain-containing protein n=1 Tax=Undibacterium piscinae TaxID=2495591 RepID=A0A6M4A938_9BURK|nr:DUF4102 domain-containing protein [Undibacterium piscinae]
MYLSVNANGARYSHMAYRLNQRRNTLASGKYPDISLLHARDQRMAARELTAS